MVEQKITLSAPNGLHARPAGELVRLVKSLAPTKVTIAMEVKQANAASMLSVLALGLKCDTQATVKAEGGDEAGAVKAVTDFLLSIKD